MGRENSHERCQPVCVPQLATQADIHPTNIYCATTTSQAACLGAATMKKDQPLPLWGWLSKGYGQEAPQEFHRKKQRTWGCGRRSGGREGSPTESKIRLQQSSTPERDQGVGPGEAGQRERRVQNYLSQWFPRTLLFASINSLLGGQAHTLLFWETNFLMF